MAIPGVVTSQTGGRIFDAPELTKYSMFVGGNNATHHALLNYSPLLNGFGRLFMVRPPLAIAKMFAGSDGMLYSKDSLFVQFKHMLEYMNRTVTGFTEKTLEPAGTSIQGGFAGREWKTPTVTKEQTTSIQIGLYEMVGVPVYTVIDGWMNAIGDENSGLATYGGWISGGRTGGDDPKEVRLYYNADLGENSDGSGAYPFNEAYHTAEFIYVMHDRSGAQVERAVMLADCYPTGIDEGAVLNMDQPGGHDNVTYNVTFNCVVYRSPIITAIANDLLKQYRIVSNSLNFNPELGDAVYAKYTGSNVEGAGIGVENGILFNRSLGAIPVDSATGTNIGNVPAFNPNNTPTTKEVRWKNMNRARLAGQETYVETAEEAAAAGYGDGENPYAHIWDGFAAT